MSTALAVAPQATDLERVLIGGDLSKLSAEQRVEYVLRVCQSLGLNHLTQPFKYIPLSGKLTLYATKDCTEQLRKLHGVSVTEVTSQRLEDVFVVTAKALDRHGRTDASTGAVPIANLKGEALANALMKAETKAKRRVTLSICGLGMLDETELETIPMPLAVKAPKLIELPAGTVQILSSVIGEWGGSDITVVDEHGAESIHKTTERQLGELCEQIAQEAVPVTLEFQTITRGKNAGKEKLVAVHRYKTPEQIAAENAALDAEVLAADADAGF